MPTKRVPAASESVETRVVQGADGTAWQVPIGESGALVVEPDDETEAAEFAIIDRVRALLAQSGEGIQIKLFRVSPLTKKREYCQNYAPDDLENVEERIREQWGAGSYEVKIFNSRGIAPGGRILLTLAAQTVKPASTNAAPINDAIALMLKQMADSQHAIMEALARIGTAPPAPAPHEQMKATLELLTMAKTLTSGAAPAPASNQVEMMREVFGMIREAKGAMKELVEEEGGSDPDNPMSMVREFLQTARGVMQAQQTPMLAGPPANANAAPIPSVSMPPSFSDATGESADMFNLQKHVAELESMLTRGEPPEAAAQYLYEWLPAALVPMLSGDAWFAVVSSSSSILGSNRDWCDKARSKCIELFTEAKKQGLL